jgi:hypothetical protein
MYRWTSCGNRSRGIVTKGGAPPFSKGVPLHADCTLKPMRRPEEDGELLRMLIAERFQEPTNPPPETRTRGHGQTRAQE